jgi:hypothetical protein
VDGSLCYAKANRWRSAGEMLAVLSGAEPEPIRDETTHLPVERSEDSTLSKAITAGAIETQAKRGPRRYWPVAVAAAALGGFLIASLQLQQPVSPPSEPPVAGKSARALPPPELKLAGAKSADAEPIPTKASPAFPSGAASGAPSASPVRAARTAQQPRPKQTDPVVELPRANEGQRKPGKKDLLDEWQ